MAGVLSSLPSRAAARQRTRHPSKLISLWQAQNLMEALVFAREIGTPLNPHVTIHWVGTNAGDDPDGRRFAKVREGPTNNSSEMVSRMA
jgi:hypothetical protein